MNNKRHNLGLRHNSYGFRNWRFALVMTLACLCTYCPGVRADWANSRENNRHHHDRDEHAHHDFGGKRRQAYDLYSPGMTVTALPVGYVQTSAGGTGYYYYDGVYFQPVASLASGYVVVAPPVGVVVPQLPSGTQPVADGSATYYYAGGAFYMPEPNGFAVIPAPMGVAVTSLPAGATPVNVKGALYFLAANVYYQPARLGATTVYTTVRP